MEEDYISIDLDLDEELLWNLFYEAHRKDITLNKLINNMMKEFLNTIESDE